MKIPTTGILSPGDMGHAIGRVLHQHGMRVITTVRDRSERTRALASMAGFQTVVDDDTLVREADILLSILPPAMASHCAERIAAALRATGTKLVFADCNAIAPQTAHALDHLITEAGGTFVDVGIIGGPPRVGEQGGPRLYASGAHAADLALLSNYGLDVRVLGEQSGQASGLKMCYASLTKGLTALATEAFVAASLLGLQEPLSAEFQALPFFTTIERLVPGMPPKAYRWVGEMEEIARTFSDLGLPPQMPQGAASLYRLMEGTVLGREIPEQRHHGQTLEEVIAILAAALGEQTSKDRPNV